jgi:hypothetical protein
MSIVMNLHLKGLSAKVKAKAKDVHTKLPQVLGSDAVTSPTVTKYMRNDAIWQNESEAEDRAEDQDLSITYNAIMEAFEIMPFASIRQIAKMTFIPPTAIFRRLAKSPHFVLKRLRWIPHRLSDLQKQIRVIMSKELLELFEPMRHYLWKYKVILDEPWF